MGCVFFLFFFCIMTLVPSCQSAHEEGIALILRAYMTVSSIHLWGGGREVLTGILSVALMW